MIAINPKQRLVFEHEGAKFFVRPPKHFEVFELRRRWAEFVATLQSDAFKFAAEVKTDGLTEEAAASALSKANLNADQLKAMIDSTERMADLGKQYLVGWEGVVDESGSPVLAELVPSGERLTDASLECLPVNALAAIGTFVSTNAVNIGPKKVGK